MKICSLMASRRRLRFATRSRRAAAALWRSSAPLDNFSLPKKKLPFPAVHLDGQLKTRQAPGTSSEPYLIPVLAEPKPIICALDRLRAIKPSDRRRRQHHHQPTAPKVRLCQIRLSGPTLETRLPLQRLLRHLLPLLQTSEPDRRHIVKSELFT
jgi:hypothetical protein